MDYSWLQKNVEAYTAAHKPDTGYTDEAAKAVIAAAQAGKFPNGTNLGVQFALQFDGKETAEDLVVFSKPEVQLPYLASWSLDKGADCVDFIRNVKLALVGGENPGDWSEGMWQKWRTQFIPFEERRELDAILYKIGTRNPHATHGSLYIGHGKILHTTGKTTPLRVQDDTYRRANIVGVCRIFNEKEYASLLYKADATTPPTPESTNLLTYTVQKGDSLYAIARKCNISFANLLKMNPQIKNPNLIHPGDKINLSLRYMVQRGDTMYAIAKRFGLALAMLITLNPQVKNPNLIRPGDILNLGHLPR